MNVCIYCGRPPAVGPDGRWHCVPCRAWVGTHRDGRPLGTPADALDRQLRMAAHRAFDPLWQSGRYRRNAAYRALAKRMQMPVATCHIGMMHRQRLADVIWHARDMMAGAPDTDPDTRR